MANGVWKKIEAGEIAPVYLLTGLEHHIFDETVERLKKGIEGIEDASVIRYDLGETAIEEVIEEADTLPFLQDHKLIIANNALFLTGKERKKNDIEHNVKVLEAWLENPSPTATVVFIAPYETLDGRKTIVKKIRKLATVIEAKRLEGKDLLVWIQNEAQLNGVYISSDLAQKLINMAGDNLVLLATEISKMATYLGADGEITGDIMELLVPRTPEMDVFTLTDAYIKGNVPGSLSIYYDLLQNGEEPIMLTSLIAGHIRLMIHVQSLRKKGYQQQQIAKVLAVHPYRVKLMMENRNVPDEKRLLSILKNLANIDYKLKSTSGNRKRVLELFLMEGLR